MKPLYPAMLFATLCMGGPLTESTGASPEIVGRLEFAAVVRPYQILNLGAARDGLIQSINFELGDHVHAGDIVATLDNRSAQAQADLTGARAARDTPERMVKVRLEDVQRRLDAQKALFQDGLVTAETLGTLETEVGLEQLAAEQQAEEKWIAQLEHKRALATLAEATIASPIDGIVTESALSQGEFYSRSGQAAVLTIVDLDPLVIEVNIPVELFESITVGHQAMVQLDVYGNPGRQALVVTKDRILDMASRTFKVRLHMGNPDYKFPAGLRCNVQFAE